MQPCTPTAVQWVSKGDVDLFTVALVGADGSGKTTLAHRLVETLPMPSRYVYMGINLEASNLVLPTTRLLLELRRMRGRRPDMRGPFDPSMRKPVPRSMLKRMASTTKSVLRTVNTLAEEWFRQAVIAVYQRRGNVVIVDRHFLFDYYFHHVMHKDVRLAAGDRLHGRILDRFYPRPDLVICLDAPAEVLFRRKGEGNLQILENRRQEYLQLHGIVKDFVVIDASLPQAMVLELVQDLICDFTQTWQKRRLALRGDRQRGAL